MQRKQVITSASEGKIITDMTKRTLQGMSKDENFVLLWQNVNQMARFLIQYFQENEGYLKDFKISSAPAEHCAEPKDRYLHIYFEGLDLLVQAVVTDTTNQNIVHICVCNNN